MFICRGCIESKYANRQTGYYSFGPCEVCKKDDFCADIKSSDLVIKSKKCICSDCGMNRDESDMDRFCICPPPEEKQTQNMKKTIEMSLETAREIYLEFLTHAKSPSSTMYKILTDNFTQEELEGKKGYTWEESFSGGGHYICAGMTGTAQIGNAKSQTCNQGVFKTEKQALSALAFAQLSHIVDKFNEDKKSETHAYAIGIEHGKLVINTVAHSRPNYHLVFLNWADANISLAVNNDLWKQYWGI